VISRRELLLGATSALIVRQSEPNLIELSNPIAQESIRGYRKVRIPHDVVIVPGLQGYLPPLPGSYLLVLESGIGFARRSEAAQHRVLLRGRFGFDLERPKRHREYIHYTWPMEAWVRDFGDCVPVSPDCGEPIAWAGGTPVAMRRGRVVYLGCALGPHLLGGDAQAHALLNSLMQTRKRVVVDV
jgi:hypothetical protein